MCNARIVITHAGVGNIITCLNHNKIPITVPRQRLYGEHVDNHQLEFIKEFEKLNSVIPVYNISHLKTYIEQYDKIAAKKVLRKNNTDTVINYFQELFLKF